jgi:hypothetical protein
MVKVFLEVGIMIINWYGGSRQNKSVTALNCPLVYFLAFWYASIRKKKTRTSYFLACCYLNYLDKIIRFHMLVPKFHMQTNYRNNPHHPIPVPPYGFAVVSTS